MMKSIKSKLNQKGFSLIELMVVIVIMLILAGIAIPAFMGVVKDANKTKAKSEARTVLMLAQLAVNKNPELVDVNGEVKTFNLKTPLEKNDKGEAIATSSIFGQASISDDEQGFYGSTKDGEADQKASVGADNKVTIYYNNDDTGVKFQLPEAADDDAS